MEKTRAAQIQDYLDTLLTAAVSPVACSLGWPVGGLADEQVWISSKVHIEKVYVVSGLGQHEEHITLEARVKVTKTTALFTDVRDRTDEISGQVEAAIRGDVTLGGLADQVTVSASDSQEALPEEQTRELGTTLTILVVCTVA